MFSEKLDGILMTFALDSVVFTIHWETVCIVFKYLIKIIQELRLMTVEVAAAKRA